MDIIETRTGSIVDVQRAVRRSLQPDPYSYSGTTEQTQKHAENCADFLAKLTGFLAAKGVVAADELNDLLSFEFIVKDEP